MQGSAGSGVRVGVLGPLQVIAPGGRPVAVGGARLRALLIRLALDAGALVPAEVLVDALWPGAEAPGDQANALHSLVSRLRRALPGGAELLRSQAGGYRLELPPGAVDALRFEELARAGRRALSDGDLAAAAGPLREALALWRGPALADAGEAPYALAVAARLEELRLTAVEDLAEAELNAGRHAAVLAELEGLVAQHPLRERALGLLMRARYAAGRQAEALAAYEAHRARLAEELGVDPSPELRAVHLAVLRAEAPETDRAAGNLPAPLTSFVGREEELGLIRKQLAESRLVTLVGPGGAGKTRLATTAAARLAEGYPGGAWLVELASVTDPHDVPQAVLAALGRRVTAVQEHRPPGTPGPSSPHEATDLLAEALGPGAPTLLLLDNCEHLIGAAARLADGLLTRCPRLRVLATSREPLALVGEALCPVPPLATPPDGAGADEAAGHAAVRLFVDRAAAVRPGFALNRENAAPVAEICRRLDGLPLAIELAAARLRTLDPAHLAARLDDRFRLLTGGSRTALPRHQTLRAVVAWSWELLTEAERALAERLSVFAGGATPESVEGACGVPAEEALDLLASLADKSLLQRAEAGEGPGPRFRMLETLREYGMERLAEAGSAGAARDAHAAHFLRLAERAEPRLRGPAQLRWIDVLIAERDNLLAALHHAVGSADAATAVRLAAALGQFWTMQGNHAEAASRLRSALAVPGEAPAEARAVAMTFAVLNGAAGGSADSVAPLVEELRGRLRAIDPLTGHPVLATLEPGLAMYAERAVHGMEATARALRHTDPWARAMLRLMRAAIRENEGDPHGEHEELALAAEGFRATGDRWGLALTLASQGLLSRQLGDLDGAVAALREAIRLLRELRAESDAEQMRVRLAAVRGHRGERAEARAELEELAGAAERRGSAFLAASARLALGDLLRQSGDGPGAARQYAEAVAHADSRVFVQPQLNALIRAGAALTGPAEEAVGLLSEAWEGAVEVRDMPVAASVAVRVAELVLSRGQDPGPGRPRRGLADRAADPGARGRGVRRTVRLGPGAEPGGGPGAAARDPGLSGAGRRARPGREAGNGRALRGGGDAPHGRGPRRRGDARRGIGPSPWPGAGPGEGAGHAFGPGYDLRR
ncbi:BTAD domain-containing putative transcriptional regulator [Streptomyces sp. DSM 44917]|uniref:BTAD domain-containing putative transcriptional regulator n=1 Tax=Streptomyces boetiae TaxID=3075541 RepID=A0ABU2L5U2_9ACTN|nr:BTAD domain-containing putative transcriptional regulator [Streptomyces sp. DSM 44917]MDT0306934.1 BTAD domain-containing putative transcriptional regulator [Streptomyces sp. DSM 44917]